MNNAKNACLTAFLPVTGSCERFPATYRPRSSVYKL